MENNNLDKKIINKVRDKIVVSNMEKEENMKISKRKTMISVVTLVVIFTSGGFFTANAAIEGKLAKDVKEFIVNKCHNGHRNGQNHENDCIENVDKDSNENCDNVNQCKNENKCDNINVNDCNNQSIEKQNRHHHQNHH